MPRLSQSKKDKITEQILHYLYSVSPELKFTFEIAKEIVRDEEFTRSLLEEIKSNKLITEVVKNPQGINYLRRRRWRLTDEAYSAYAKLQKNTQT